MKITFSINLHNKTKDIVEDCILLHLGDTTIIKIKDVKELEQMIIDLGDIRTDLVDNYNL